MIKIKNIYYMLSYAYSVLQEDGYKSILTEEFDHAADLFSAILDAGISTQIKRGLARDYIEKSEEVSVPVGKINISASIRRLTFLKSQLNCTFDEFSEDILINQIIKSTMLLLIKSKDVKIKRRKSLKKLSIRFQRNNITYRMLINVCYLVVNGLLMSDSDGSKKFMTYLDDQNMYRLYEKFVLNFYKRHYPQFKPNASEIKWHVEDEVIDFLPKMKSDITLVYGGKVFIIDTKWYGHSLQINSMYNNQTYHSANLYQIFTYVKNRDTLGTGDVSGALLYAKTDEVIFPDEVITIGGNRFFIKTLDLNKDFDAIRLQLDHLVTEWLEM